MDILRYHKQTYLGPSSHIGTNGIDELEIIEYSFLSANQIQRNQDTIIYIFKYKVTANATSFDYWGSDYATNEILLSPTGSHTFEGEIKVKVVREANIYLDFEADDGFENATIISGNLNEINYQPIFENDDKYLEGAYTTCPDCGCKINFENDGGNGFCINCAPEH